MNRFAIASGIATGTTGWLPAVRVGGEAIPLQSLHALAEGTTPAFDIELWITTEERDGEPFGFWKLEPNLVGESTTEFPTEATEGYLFDAPFLWIRPRVVSLTGTLSIWGIV